MESKDYLNQVTHTQLQQEINYLGFRNRRTNLEIHGIVRVSDESLLSVLSDVAKKLEVPSLMEADVETAHRLPTR